MTETLTVSVSDAQIRQMRTVFESMGKTVDGAIARAVNHAGDKALTAVARALVAQTGLRRQTIAKALVVRKASAAKGTSTYSIRSRGGDISLRYFGARETTSGVSAAPLGQRRVFTGTFMKAGRFPARVAVPGWNGQVFRRTGGKTSTGKDRFEKVRSGVYIPEQMVTGASADAFRTTVAVDLPARLDHELRRVLSGQAE